MTKKKKKSKDEKDLWVKCPHCPGKHRAGARFCTRTGREIPGSSSQVQKKIKSAVDAKKPASPPMARTSLYPVPALEKPAEKPRKKKEKSPAPARRSTVDVKLPLCPHCKAPLSRTGARFCISCGKKINPSASEFAPVTAAEVSVSENTGKDVCPYRGCEKPLEGKELFCPHCYGRLYRCFYCGKYTTAWKDQCVHCGKARGADSRNWPMFKGDPAGTGFTDEIINPPSKEKWRYPDSRNIFPIMSSPIVYRGLVYYGSCDTNIHALNQYTGESVWKKPTNGMVTGTPAIHEGVLYAGSNDGKVHAMDARRGRPLWVYPHKKKESIGGITAGIVAVKEGVFVPTNRGELYRLDPAEGKPVWKFSAGGKREAVEAADGQETFQCSPSPVVFEDMVFWAAPDGFLYCIDIPLGRARWRFPGDKPNSHRFLSTPAVGAGICYIPDRSGKFYAVSIDKGEDTWADTVELCSVVEGSPSVGYGKIFTGTQNQYLVTLNLHSGGEIWRRKNERIRLMDSIFSTPTITRNNLVFYGSNSAYLYGRDINTGEMVAAEKLDSPIRSAPAISDGYLYVTTAAGILYAFVREGDVERQELGVGNWELGTD